MCVCVRISILWADGGRGCLALMTVHPDGWCQSDTEAQQHLKSLWGEFESCSNSYSGSHSVWTISARLRSPHLLPYISSRWLTVSVGTFQESVFAFSTAAFDMFFFFFSVKNELDAVNRGPKKDAKYKQGRVVKQSCLTCCLMFVCWCIKWLDSHPSVGPGELEARF